MQEEGVVSKGEGFVDLQMTEPDRGAASLHQNYL